MRIRLVFPVLLLAAAACNSASKAPPDTDAWTGQLVAYQRVVSNGAPVGYVKTYEYSNPSGGEPFLLFHVFDKGFVERGVIDQLGVGRKYIEVPYPQADVRHVPREIEQLPAQPLEWNVAKILGAAPGVKLVAVRPSDLMDSDDTIPGPVLD